MTYIAHKSGDRVQLLIDHLAATARLTEDFASVFNAGEFAKTIALYHDAGKYSDKFQNRIRGASIKVDHSTAGAKFLYESNNKNILSLIAAYCIAGHHGGLPNGGSPSQPQEGELYARLQKQIENSNAISSNLEYDTRKLTPPSTEIKNGFQASLFTRMIYSCLVDADWLDTEEFMLGKNPRGGFESISRLWEVFSNQITKFNSPKNKLDLMRTEILKNCLDAAEQKCGIYTLTAPTGSGKTVSSMAFALKHAVVNEKRRVIYVVPYNTIIEQNAEVFEKMLGTENVLQHHSGIEYSNDEDSPNYKKLLATENWDASVVITSSVRFFESLYANRPSDCRKLHNIAGSVIVFDEAQMIPLPYLIPCVEAMKELVVNYQCTIVLATATQSSLDTYFHPLNMHEIITNPGEMYQAFKRVYYDCSLGKLTDDELAYKLTCLNQVLCIVNTRRRAQSLTEKIDGAIHLSTTMYPSHRSEVLSEIRKKLNDGEPCKVISTSLIEAGVDVDFPVVFREKAGLDSIIQAAGRCNRENIRKQDESIVYVFESDSKPHVTIAQNICAYENVARKNTDIASLEAISDYFQQLRYIIGQENLDKKSVVQMFINGAKEAFSLPFENVAKDFHLIENETKTVYVLVNNPLLATRLRENHERSRELFRELQKYTVSLYQSDFHKLEHQFERLDDDLLLLTAPEFYSDQIGIKLTEQGGTGLFY